MAAQQIAAAATAERDEARHRAADAERAAEEAGKRAQEAAAARDEAVRAATAAAALRERAEAERDAAAEELGAARRDLQEVRAERDTAAVMPLSQLPNQRAIGRSAMADLMRAARQSPGLAATQAAGFEYGSTYRSAAVIALAAGAA